MCLAYGRAEVQPVHTGVPGVTTEVSRQGGGVPGADSAVGQGIRQGSHCQSREQGKGQSIGRGEDKVTLARL